MLIERFSLPKNYLKAKAFAYNQIQGLVRKGLFEVAKILIERFSLPKNYLKAKAFAYNQIQGLVRKGL
ncbi:hypothetical protein R3X47_23855, partial [Salmonella enterica subsp. enterica serovar Bareilly]|nr:hypothetical protein [Salmonella enterica subsp. enterica serovar Bareilly]